MKRASVIHTCVVHLSFAHDVTLVGDDDDGKRSLQCSEIMNQRRDVSKGLPIGDRIDQQVTVDIGMKLPVFLQTEATGYTQ